VITILTLLRLHSSGQVSQFPKLDHVRLSPYP
jgi:hypothetical protein